MISPLRTIFVGLWFLAGAALGIWSIREVLAIAQDDPIHWGGLFATLLFLSFSALPSAGAILTLRSHSRGPILLKVAAGISLAYSAVYFLFGGLEEGLVSSILVLAIALLAAATFVLLSRHRYADGNNPEESS